MTLSKIKQLAGLGIHAPKAVFCQLDRTALIAHAIQNGEATQADNGALNILTGKFTGRSPKDRYLVKDEITENRVFWNEINQAIAKDVFNELYDLVSDYLSSKELFVRDCQAVSYEELAKHILVVSEKATQDLFVSNMFIESPGIENTTVDWTVLVASDLQIPNYQELDLNASNCVAIDFSRRVVLVIGTAYTGEIKKSIFSILNFVLPVENAVLSMHCSANVGKDGDTALFFGLSGTGKTTLSADVNRYLVGDDEHGWSNQGVFNFEGGCYAKCLGLDPQHEPEICGAIKSGSLLENIKFYEGTAIPNFQDASITENMRVSYPLAYISSYREVKLVDAPDNIFFLSADAFGVLPPISKLTIEQAMYYFINGYTAKVAGTEMGVSKPTATFSACFGQAFMPLHPMEYAELLRDKLKKNPNTKVWLVNTGWIGGPYGIGRRIKLAYTRSLIQAALSGELEEYPMETHPIFRLNYPTFCQEVPQQILSAKELWGNDEAYDGQAKALKLLFENNFKKYQDTYFTTV
ncbi:phosphoenolpyruvate carboxykinase (ATP) [Sphingobacterium sp. SRCM116780]|uniref:phosphoenolpyruvate carboxykinase (ATP) n=1 Tax=Sphingobacterium sp. SRCM116780 TaxID=2907623 RepID=UPI001F2FF4FA|nr:phosphoenolpyruvate carboxykinase (ATP) [Sphingobacterium sp. SRCM116780]UIR56780.1 phosphoenolpyruvate carboxykinase (ATP) [Sphingobacterium sp. SRCM116780]